MAGTHELFLGCSEDYFGAIESRESRYDFYMRSGRPEIIEARKLMEACYDAYPDREKPDILCRVQCGNDTNFKSAEFELLINALLQSQGCSLTPHPDTEVGTKPDFLVHCPDGTEFYLEAKLVAGSEFEFDDPQYQELQQRVSAYPHNSFHVGVNIRGTLNQMVPFRKLRDDIHGWLDSLDPDVDMEQQESIRTFNRPGCELRVTAYPLPLEQRGKARQLIVMHGTGAAVAIDPTTGIKRAVRVKASRYGTLDRPYIIAVGVEDSMLDHDSMMDALFGSVSYQVSRTTGETTPIREANGILVDPHRRCFRYLRVSGVWVFAGPRCDTIGGVTPGLFLHPEANLPLTNTDVFPGQINSPNEQNTMDKTNNVSTQDALNSFGVANDD